MGEFLCIFPSSEPSVCRKTKMTVASSGLLPLSIDMKRIKKSINPKKSVYFFKKIRLKNASAIKYKTGPGSSQ
jgi:hypothetical protein